MPYLLMHSTLDGVAESFWYTYDDEGNRVPVEYDTYEEAQREIDDVIDDMAWQVEQGNREPDEVFTRDEFEIVRKEDAHA